MSKTCLSVESQFKDWGLRVLISTLINYLIYRVKMGFLLMPFEVVIVVFYDCGTDFK